MQYAPAVTPPTAAAGAAPRPPVAAGDDHGDFAVNATMVALFTVAPGSIETETDKDYFSFTAEKGFGYTIEVDEPEFNANMRLFDQDGISLLFSSSSSKNWNAPESGTYYVQIAAWTQGKTGNYTIAIVRQVGHNGKRTGCIRLQRGQLPIPLRFLDSRL